jgi:hypothetical protein
MIAPTKPDVSVDDKIEVLSDLAKRRIELHDAPISEESIRKLTELASDYIRLVGPWSHNAIALQRRIKYFRRVLAHQTTKQLV